MNLRHSEITERSDDSSDTLTLETLAERALWTSEYCGKINEFFAEKVGEGQVEETALPALKLHLFNYLSSHPQATRGELEKEFARISRLSDMERDYGEEGNPLPTIGIEIELPRTHLSPEQVEVLERLGIPNEDAIDWQGVSNPSKLWEGNPSFSYSPWVPARVLQELSVMGAVPLEESGASGHPRIPKDDAFSLHVNFGVPDWLLGATLEEKSADFFLLNDCLTYAFSTPERLRKRKTMRSIYVGKSAKESKKAKGENAVSALQNNEEAEGDDLREQSGPRRVELRAMEFRDYPTFRMLAESQKLMAMLFGSLQCRYDIERSPRTEALALLWSGFEKEVLEYFEQLQLPVKSMDVDKERVAGILEKTDLKQHCRTIVQRYAKGVTRVITQKTDDEHVHQQ